MQTMIVCLKTSAFACIPMTETDKIMKILKSESLMKYVRMQNVSVNQKCLAADEKSPSI